MEKLEIIPDYGDKFTLQEFEDACKQGAFVNYDGSGYYSNGETYDWNKPAYPSDFRIGNIDKSYSHVIWFNK